MNLKGFRDFLKSKFLWINIGIAVLLIVVILVVLSMSLSSITHHGEEVEVPNLIGLNEEEARVILQSRDITGEVIDSVYVKGKKSGTIVEQSPIEKTKVKKGRHIYLTINSKSPRMIPIPDLNDVSYRQAEATLRSYGFNVRNIQYVPSEFAGLVIEIKYNGENVTSGMRLPDGANLVLVVGETASDADMARVPQLCTLTYKQAIQVITEAGFVVGGVMTDETINEADDKSECFVYKQDPVVDQWSMMGKRIDIWLTKDSNKGVVEETNEEEFF